MWFETIRVVSRQAGADGFADKINVSAPESKREAG